MTEFGGAIIGTPDDAVEKIARLQELSGGFGTILSFGHDWTNREQQRRSYEMIARYVMPQGQWPNPSHRAIGGTRHREARAS